MRHTLRFGVALAALAIASQTICVDAATVSRGGGSSPSMSRSPAPSPPRMASPPPQVQQRSVTPGSSPLVQQRQATGGNTVQRQAIVPGKAPPAVAASAPSAVDKRMTQGHSQNALNNFRADQAKFTAPAVNLPTTRAAALQTPVMRQYGSRWGNADQYYAARTSSIGRLPPAYGSYWNSPPRYVLVRPAYGAYSSVFLGSLLGVGVTIAAIDAGSAMWAYSHRTDPDYMAWRQEMTVQGQSDPSVVERMAQLDRQVGDLEQQGVTSDPNALPEGVDPSLVVAPEAVLMATSEEESQNPLGWGAAIIGTVGGVLFLAFLLHLYNRNRRRTAFG